MQNIPQYPILTKVEGESIGYFNFTIGDKGLWGIGDDTTSSEGVIDKFPFNIEIYESNQKTYKSFVSGNADGDETIYYDIQWEFLSNIYEDKRRDTSDFKIKENKNNNNNPYLCLNMIEDSDGKELYSFKKRSSYFGAANILKCTITRTKDKEKDIFYATLPIVTVVINKNNTKKISTVNIKNGTGYQFVQYSSGGLDPHYNDLIPFELEVYDNNNEITENLNYYWNTIGQIYDYIEYNTGHKGGSYLKNFSFNILEVKNDDDNVIPYKINAQAYQSYDGLNVTNGISCFITDKNQTDKTEEEIIKNAYAFINIPIHCYLNRYAFANLNVWDGNSIQVDKKGGYILTPQIGAGHKEEDNSFTGLLMGDIKESSWTEKQTGLFAYNQGTRTIFLDAKDGTALFGTGNGQIAIAPGNKTWIYSKNFWNNNCFDEKGKLKDKVKNDIDAKKPKYASKNGLLIDLEKPSIVYGNGNFKVDDQGNLTARNMTLLDGWINCGKGKFTVDDKGNLTANNAELNNAKVTGKVSASSFNFKYFDETTSEIKSDGFYIKGQKGNNSSYMDMGFIGQGSKVKQDNVIGMTIGLKPRTESYISLGVWDKKEKAYISKICWSSDNGLYKKQGVHISDNCYFSAPAGAYWDERFISSVPGHYYVGLNDGRYLHFINGIFITVNWSQYI